MNRRARSPRISSSQSTCSRQSRSSAHHLILTLRWALMMRVDGSTSPAPHIGFAWPAFSNRLHRLCPAPAPSRYHQGPSRCPSYSPSTPPPFSPAWSTAIWVARRPLGEEEEGLFATGLCLPLLYSFIYSGISCSLNQHH